MTLIDQYGAPPADKRYSPLLFEDHTDLAPRVFFSVCGWDPRRDDGLLFAQILKEAGAQTKLDIHPGLPHGFWQTCPELPVSIEWEMKLLAGVKFVLGDEGDKA